MSEKTILEQALLQVQTLEEAVKQNAKGILASTMKQELSDLLKESLEEEEKVEESTEVSVEETMEPKEEEKDMSEQPEDDETKDDDVAGDDESDDDSENDDTLDNEDPSKGIDSIDSDDDGMSADDAVNPPSDESPMSDDSAMNDDDSMDDEVMDMTGASDDEVLKVFKAMKPEDGIVVKKDGDNVSFEDGNDEYIIKLDDEGDDSVEEDQPMDEESWNEEESPIAEADSVDEDSLYEIELGEEEEEKEEEDVKEEKEDQEESEKVEATEAARTKWNPHGDKGGANRAGIKSKKVFKAGSGALNEEVENLKKQNAEYKKALVLFKEKLNEVAVFNANLAYATRLFTEHSTTKQEKLNILKRFDSVSSLNESKNLFNTIKTELGSKTTVTETVVEKISTTPQTSSSQEVLAEAKAYENPQFKRMKDLMSKIK